MKTKDLIKKLQEEDPTGEEHVVVENIDISCVYKEEAYWDGAAQKIIRDEKGKPIGGKYCREGCKIQIRTLDFNTLIWDRPEIPMDYSELDEDRQKTYAANHAKVRQKAKDCDYELELENFTDWVAKKTAQFFTKEDIKADAKEFFDANLTPYDPMPSEIPIIGESWISRRQLQWDSQIDVYYWEDWFKIEKKEKEHGSV